jgi:hypothetical protein
MTGRFQTQGAELTDRFLSVEIAERSDDQFALPEFTGWLTVRSVIVPLRVVERGDEHLGYCNSVFTQSVVRRPHPTCAGVSGNCF